MSEQQSSSGNPVPPPNPGVPPVQIQSLTPGGSSSSAVPIPAAPVIPPPTASSAVQLETAAYEEGAPVYAEGHPEFQQPHYAPAPKKNIFVQYWNKVGGGSFLISLLIHAGLLIGAFFIVKEYSTEKKVDFLPGGGNKEGQQASQQLSQKVQNKKRSSLNKSNPMRKVVSMSATSAISLPEVPMESIDMPEMSSLMGGSMGSGGFGSGGAGGGFGKGTGIGGNTGFVSLPPSMRSRCSSAERLQKLKESGGTAECERAVSNALEYLKSKQKPDGSWGTNSKGAMTGFALLCFLGRCETPESIYYGDNVMKGILFLIEMQKKNPYKMFSQATSGNAPVYEHGIATYALGEMYTLARMGSKSLPGMREAFEDGVKVIIDNQQAGGSWVYDTEKGFYSPSREDLSVTGWQYQALKAAKLTSLKINGLGPAIDKTVKYIEGKQTKDGGIGNPNREGGYNQWNLTGAGTLGLQTLAHGGKKTEIKKAIGFAHELFKKEPPEFTTGDMYGWYYYHQCFFQYGGEEWKYWNELVLPQLLKAQQPDGSWKPNGAAHNPSAGGDNVYSTALCTLMLEVYYRYLKVGDREQKSMFDR
ncbi:prenyltransferase/squalene oxidase repeat-containing protein [Roseimicrobium sp. ORNL1]|uniref:prenyltransferase/squalene oxidase repeat-containing protein n=1 Tax=Roseimicrobium sp. ORNL1 TaxID=2711231 RepID=UPI0013E112D8|nr:prenyltransferase/squalene oxidase repeat-containing protein [Roseimicrobium sp. ORNL1]QIF00927.1 terpene cyclase/mutase family protein [Roseimicrobium sp. ORNL1]